MLCGGKISGLFGKKGFTGSRKGEGSAQDCRGGRLAGGKADTLAREAVLGVGNALLGGTNLLP